MTRRAVVIAAAAALGVLAGAGLTMAVQRDAREPSPGPARALAAPPTTPETPSTFLVWVPRGMPHGFASTVASVPKIAATTLVAEDDTWLRRSWTAGGELVDHPPAGYRIPIDTAAVDPATFASFVPAPHQPLPVAPRDVRLVRAGRRPTRRGRAEPRRGDPGWKLRRLARARAGKRPGRRGADAPRRRRAPRPARRRGRARRLRQRRRPDRRQPRSLHARPTGSRTTHDARRLPRTDRAVPAREPGGQPGRPGPRTRRHAVPACR